MGRKIVAGAGSIASLAKAENPGRRMRSAPDVDRGAEHVAHLLVSELRSCSDEALLRECRVQVFRGSGPGGQHRNKTSTAVRIVHEPSGVTAIASESRSQDRNREEAIRRLRHRLALTQRQAIDAEGFQPPEWFKGLAAARLMMGRKSGEYLPAMGLVIDALSCRGWSVSETARLLGISTGTLARFLKGDEKLFGYVNERRGEAGLKPLGRD